MIWYFWILIFGKSISIVEVREKRVFLENSGVDIRLDNCYKVNLIRKY